MLKVSVMSLLGTRSIRKGPIFTQLQVAVWGTAVLCLFFIIFFSLERYSLSVFWVFELIFFTVWYESTQPLQLLQDKKLICKFKLQVQGNIRQQRMYPCSLYLFIQGGAWSLLNDLYCLCLLIEHQLKFPRSHSWASTSTYCSCFATFVSASLSRTCSVFWCYKRAHMWPFFRHEFTLSSCVASRSHINKYPDSSSVLCFTANPSIWVIIAQSQ